MKISRIIIWAGFVVIVLVFAYHYRVFAKADVPQITFLGSPDAGKEKAVFSSWNEAQLLPVVRRVNWFDFAFVFFYVAILFMLSNRQVRKESSVVLNALLRANFFFVVVAGLVDLIENSFLLYNTYHWNDDFINVWWVTWLKFLLVGWTVLVWLVSFVKTRVK